MMLMIAVVVILAAVVGAFATGIFGSQSSVPQASFSVNDGDVVFEGGDNLDPSNVEVTASDGAINDQTGGAGVSNPIEAGETDASGATDVGTVRVVYTGDGGSTTIWRTDT
jgi:FlaG/FlaF family flagellin (archaellin)